MCRHRKQGVKRRWNAWNADKTTSAPAALRDRSRPPLRLDGVESHPSALLRETEADTSFGRRLVEENVGTTVEAGTARQS